MVASSDYAVEPPRRVAVLRALKLGDMLCAVPALRALRAAWPSAEITLVGLPWARHFCERFAAYIDRFYEFPGFPGLPERECDLQAIPRFFAAIQAEKYDLAMQLHGSGRTVNEIVALMGAKRCAGFCLPGDYCPDLQSFAPWPMHGLEIHRLLELVTHLGLRTGGDQLEFPLDDNDFTRLSALFETADLRPGDYAIVHPGASIAERRWPAENFAAAADALADDGLKIAITGSSGEAELCAQVIAFMRRPAENLAGRTDLGLLGALVAKAALLVANDTGVSHVAAAVKTPSVIVSTGDNPARWSPLNRRLHRVLSNNRGVEVSDVLAAARQFVPVARQSGSAHPPQLVS